MITADQANEISLNSISNEDKLLLEEIFNLIEQEAKLGKYQLIYTISGPVTSVQYIYKQLKDHGFGVGYGLDKDGYTFVIDW